jgi:phage shock protein A
MSELVQRLTDGLQQLSKQYAEDMQRLETQNTQLQQQVSSLSEQTTYLAKQVQTLIDTLNNSNNA